MGCWVENGNNHSMKCHFRFPCLGNTAEENRTAAIYMRIKTCEDIDSSANFQGLLMCAKEHGSVIFMVRLFPGMLGEMLMQYMQDNCQR